MVPRELFNRMAALAFVAILLAGALSIRAFADDVLPEDTTEDSGESLELPLEDFPEVPEDEFSEEEVIVPSSGEPSEEVTEPPAEEASGELPVEEFPEEPTREDLPKESLDSSLVEDIVAIRQCLELVVYGLIPVICAMLLVYKLCMWFYCTFIRIVL